MEFFYEKIKICRQRNHGDAKTERKWRSRSRSVPRARPQLYKWRSKFGGMGALMIKRMKELEDKNRRLKKMFAEEKLVGEIACEALVKKW